MFRVLLIAAIVAQVYCSGLLRAPLLDGRIVGGRPTTIENFPYQASVRHIQGGIYQHICGGSIIKPDVVLTAGHCIDPKLPPSSYSVQSGVTKLSLLRNVILAKRTLRHDKYNATTVDYDVALIMLLFKIPISLSSRPIPLTTQVPAAGTAANITGWGSLSEGGVLATDLQVVTVTVISDELCQEEYKDINSITERMLCAGTVEGGKDSCQGDSGGPMVVQGVQVGIISWGVGCARKGYAGVNSNIAVLRSWIEENAGPLDI